MVTAQTSGVSAEAVARHSASSPIGIRSILLISARVGRCFPLRERSPLIAPTTPHAVYAPTSASTSRCPRFAEAASRSAHVGPEDRRRINHAEPRFPPYGAELGGSQPHFEVTVRMTKLVMSAATDLPPRSLPLARWTREEACPSARQHRGSRGAQCAQGRRRPA